MLIFMFFICIYMIMFLFMMLACLDNENEMRKIILNFKIVLTRNYRAWVISFSYLCGV